MAGRKCHRLVQPGPLPSPATCAELSSIACTAFAPTSTPRTWSRHDTDTRSDETRPGSRIETQALKVCYGSRGRWFHAASHRCTIVTRVHTDLWSCRRMPNGNDDELQPAIVRMIHDEMAPRLVGTLIHTPSSRLRGDSAWPHRPSCVTDAYSRTEACLDSARCMTPSANGRTTHPSPVGRLAIGCGWIALGGYYRQDGDRPGSPGGRGR